MRVREDIRLSELTTLRAGGRARFVLEAVTEEEVREACMFAHERTLPLYVLGEGSNVLAPDAGYTGVVLCPRLMDISFDGLHAIVGAGVSWEVFVREAAARGLWGVENLAGIPGTVGAAPIQNIGAYGAEVCDIITYVDALSINNGAVTRFTTDACGFGYRDSRFKREGGYVILRVGFTLQTSGIPNVTYPDLANAVANGVPCTTPEDVGEAVRAIRAKKFPDLRIHGTAGSFFKNPVVDEATYAALRTTYPELPGYPGEGGVKVSLAYLLDKALGLRGFRMGKAWLYDKQPLVLVLDAGGTAHDVDVLAQVVAVRVHEATGISIEREVRTLA